LLEAHRVAPGKKADRIVRLIYENVNGLNSQMTDNENLDKIISLQVPIKNGQKT